MCIVKNKGLGKLQRSILALAEKQNGEVFARDVLIHVYRFEARRSTFLVWQGALVFSKSSIGRARYNSASVSVCKSFNRLVRRGLAERIQGGIRMTRINKG